MTYTTLLTERTGAVLKITTNRPEVLNAQSRILLVELDDAFQRAIDDDAVRVIILAGAGRHFSAGRAWQMMHDRVVIKAVIADCH